MRLLDRLILREILRTGVLTAAVLVTVIAFGAAIKPLSDDDLFTAGQIARYISLAMVPMLQFAVPFAAGFAGTMALHRMVSDNEILAACASGISYRRLLLPIILLGVLLTGGMVGLTQFVIPRFWGLLEQTVARDVAVHFERTIGSGEPFVMGDLQIWAEEIVPEPDPPEGVDTRLYLLEVAVADMGEGGVITTDVTAQQITIDIYRTRRETTLVLGMYDTVAFRPMDGMLVWLEPLEETTIRIPTSLRDSPKRMTLPELISLRGDPDQHAEIDARRRDLAEALRLDDVRGTLTERLERDGSVIFTSRTSTYRIEAERIDDNAIFRARGGRNVIISELDAAGVVQRTFRCRVARVRPFVGTGLGTVAHGLTMGRPERTDALRLRLELDDVAWSDAADPEAVAEREQVPLDGLRLPDFDESALLELPSAALLAMADERSDLTDERVGPVELNAKRLRERTTALQLEIGARAMSRFASSVTALLVLLLGALMAMWRRQGSPLGIYLLAFLPAVLDLIMISSGEHMIRDGAEASGLFVMWSGNAVLLGLSIFSYVRLSRH